jgi:hypothetical protein
MPVIQFVEIPKAVSPGEAFTVRWSIASERGEQGDNVSLRILTSPGGDEPVFSRWYGPVATPVTFSEDVSLDIPTGSVAEIEVSLLIDGAVVTAIQPVVVAAS